jgi:hypothetical protein
VAFVVVYIREAHAVDSAWPVTSPDQPAVEEPQALAERQAVAGTCLARLELHGLPAVVDEMDDAVNEAYEAWPDRLVLIDAQGRIAWRGGPGPYGFKPDELDAAIRRVLGLSATTMR